MEVLAQGLVLDFVPTYAHAEPEASSCEHVDLGGLLCDKSGLALGQDDHAGNKFDLLCEGSQVAEEDERLVKHMVCGVRASPVGAVLDGCSEDVVVDEKMGVT